MATRNIVPRANGEGSIGTAAKHWGAGYFDALNLAGEDVAGTLTNMDLALAESTGYGIVSGCEPTISGLTVTVGAGVVHLADGTRKEISASNITLDAADTTNPRIDLVYITSAGAIAKITGTAAATPSAPALPSNGISVTTVSVAANATTGTLTDSRGMLARWYNTGVVNVKDFGAVGDGVTDDTAAIKAAIRSGAKNIIIPSGEYYCTDAIMITKSDTVISGYGATINSNNQGTSYAIIVKSPVANADSALYEGDLRASNIKIKGLEVIGNTPMVGFLNVDDFEVKDCNIQANNEALNIRYCKGYTITDNKIVSNDGSMYGVFNYQSKKFIIKNNNIQANLCVVVKGSYNQEKNVDCIIENNYMTILTTTGTGVSTGSVVEEGSVQRGTVKNNHIYTYGGSSEHGITLSRKAEEWYVLDNVIVGGNINLCANKHYIKGNVIRNVKGIGAIRIVGDENALNDKCMIVGNNIKDCNNLAVDVGVGENYIINNYMDNCKNGIVIQASVVNNYIAGNLGTNQSYVVKGNVSDAQFTIGNVSLMNGAGTPVAVTNGLFVENIIKNINGIAYLSGSRMDNGFERYQGINIRDTNNNKDYHLWIDSSGRLRIHDDVPTSDNDGTVVGTQS